MDDASNTLTVSRSVVTSRSVVMASNDGPEAARWVVVPMPDPHNDVTRSAPLHPYRDLHIARSCRQSSKAGLMKMAAIMLAFQMTLFLCLTVATSTAKGHDTLAEASHQEADKRWALQLEHDVERHSSMQEPQQLVPSSHREARAVPRVSRPKRRNKKWRGRRSNGGRGGGRSALRQQINTLNISLQHNIHRLETQLNQLSGPLLSIMRQQQRGAIHLTPTHSDAMLHGDHHQDNYFVWHMEDNAPGSAFFNYMRSENHNTGDDIVGVKIKRPGQYQVYSQVLINGRADEYSFPHHCAHQTVLIHNNEPSVILRTYITPYQLGAVYERVNDTNLRALDSSFQMGVFQLQENDEVRISLPPNCDHFIYRRNALAAYFGLVELGTSSHWH